jgi:hypothetical protein
MITDAILPKHGVARKLRQAKADGRDQDTGHRGTVFEQHNHGRCVIGIGELAPPRLAAACRIERAQGACVVEPPSRAKAKASTA